MQLLHYTRLTASFPGQPGQEPGYQKGKTSLGLNEARDDGVLGCSGISWTIWTICKKSAPRSRQITTPTSQSLNFLQARCSSSHPTNVKALKANLNSSKHILNQQMVKMHHTTVRNTHPFNGPLSGTTRVSRYQKGKTNRSRQITHASTERIRLFTF